MSCGKNHETPIALDLTCFGINYLPILIVSDSTPFISYLIASREIRGDRSSGQGWASNRDSGNYPHHRYISDSPEQERVLIQVITIYLQDGFQ